MKISDILAIAQSTSDRVESLSNLQSIFFDAFMACPSVATFRGMNVDAVYEDASGPFVSFDLQVIVSQDFAFEAKAQLRNGQVTATVSCVHFRDGRGEGSQSYAPLKLGGFSMEEELVGSEEDSFEDFCAQIQAETIKQHAALFQAVGLPHEQAQSAAESYWRKGEVA
ncbi:hypothetical protein [Pseudomonas aeruginosa]|uniref:hypothetical protein n=1 Tax=Pseudomonas aeruginosa TaxID=287 RepID=UPI0010514A8A|nr:hypothetical protein [Pseudomonas aeruginosa]MBO8337072.1 hypothetical protein [Pseudomonas aeruginosa]HCF0590407.1 hypothetical protein [Pseudomonas aeruginosa]HCF3031063.1 hypothetical protein [Pseudomonas aeruginosa]HCF4080883.1 hypothetical protein [Pseudomonas aeruginosa]HDV6122992.1 hypothetical protein [Pseudomonas aeruginosa]